MLTEDQQTILELLMSRLKVNEIQNWNREFLHPFFIDKVGGFAGTGKTFLISVLRKEIKTFAPRVRVAFCAFTGKAASVMKRKLNEQSAVFPEDYVGTIHGLMYRPKTRYSPELNKFIIVGWDLKYNGNFSDEYDMIIVDEASMVNKKLWEDLTGLEAPIIAFGDHGQLPPIEDNNQNYKPPFQPNFLLKTIHRQALESPIIQLSIDVRNTGHIPRNTIYSEKVFKIPYYMGKCQDILNNVDFAEDDVIMLCGFNNARAGLNRMVRTRYGHEGREPYLNEKVICLKNNHSTKVMNGQIGKVLWLMPVDKDIFKMTVEMEDDIVDCLTHGCTFGEASYSMIEYSTAPDSKYKTYKKIAESMGFNQIDYFDYGYAISVHKSQGSEWQKVILIEQRARFWDNEFYKKWLYTAVTRAKESLMIVSDFNV